MQAVLTHKIDITAVIGALATSLFMLGNASPVDTRAAAPALSIQDRVLIHLQDHKLITWHVKGNGRYVDIDEVTYSSALVAIGEGTDRHNTTTTRDINKRHNCGFDLTYQITNKVCFTTGPRIAVDNTITSLAVNACDVLLDNTVPAIALNGIRLWQSAPVPGAHGLPEYLVYGLKNLVTGPQLATPSVCQGAFDLFQNCCQYGNNAWTQGGSMSIGSDVMFSLHPTTIQHG